MLCIRIHGVCSLLLLLLLPPPWSWRNGQPPATCRSRVFFSSCDLEIALRRRHRRLHLLVWCFPNSVADWKSLSSIATHSLGSHTWGKKRGRLPLEKQIGPRSATKPGRQKIPTFCSAAPGRRLPATVALLPACPRTSALHLALCPSPSRVSPFTFVLTRAHLPAFHSHYFLTAHNTQALCFSKKFFESHFLLSCSPWNRLKSQVSCPWWWWVQSSSSLPLFIVPHTALPAPPKCKRDWKNDSTALSMDLFEEKFLANSMNSLTQQQWQEIWLKIEEAFSLTPPRTSLGLKFNPKHTKRGRNLISWNMSMENLPTCLSASESQAEGRQKPRFSQSCARPISLLSFLATPAPSPGLLFLSFSYFLIHDEQMSFILYLFLTLSLLYCSIEAASTYVCRIIN